MDELINNMIEKNTRVVNSITNPKVIELFNLVADYVENNHLCVDTENDKYFIKKGNAGFELGIMYGPNLLYYIRRDELNDNIDDYIDINYVYSNLITVKQSIIINKINNINRTMDELNALGVPPELTRKFIK